MDKDRDSTAGWINANPNPIRVRPPGATTLSRTSTGTTLVEVRVGAADGPLFSRTGPSGSAATGKWVWNGTVFYLQDVSGALLPDSQIRSLRSRSLWIPPSLI